MHVLSAADARRLLVSHLALEKTIGAGATGTRKLLERLRCIQLDPLDVIGTNADLVVMARVDGVSRGELWNHLFPRHAFEHFAKERCILPASSFLRYRERGHETQTPWWRHSEREQRVEPRVVDAVLNEIAARGPLTAREITDHGVIQPLDWGGWMGTSKTTTMALEILWTRCDIVVAGRTRSGAKLYDIPERALGKLSPVTPANSFERWALRERVAAAGLLSRASGSSWSTLSSVRTSSLPDSMVDEGELVEVAIEGASRRYLALPEFLRRKPRRYDDRIRILGPLDPLLWDHHLVRQMFDFDYVREVYKPEHLRKWGWYVCPLLHRDRLIGRLEARTEDDTMVVNKLWVEPGHGERLRVALERHAGACGCQKVRMPRRPPRLTNVST